ncbi:MAG: type II secretion system protein GspG [Planctomycetes bacterium]|nr:type II secretion system protein GspG [Planctomycetota bacterium]
MSSTRRRFTLIELMVVISIIGLLATIVSVSVIDSLIGARQKVAKAEIRTLADAVKLFKMEYHRLPRNLDELLDPPVIGNRRRAPLLESAPIDPWDRPYLFERKGASYDISTLGASGEPGGEGEETDFRWSELKRSRTRGG